MTKKLVFLSILSSLLFSNVAFSQGIYRVDDGSEFNSWKTSVVSISDTAVILEDTALKCTSKNLSEKELNEISSVVKDLNKAGISQVLDCVASDGDGGYFITQNKQAENVELVIVATGIITEKALKLTKLK